MRYFQNKGENVIPYKPVQTGIIVENSRQYYEDTHFYQTFSEGTLVEEYLIVIPLKSLLHPIMPPYVITKEEISTMIQLTNESIQQYFEQSFVKGDA